ncbi:DUF4339 domain-containing protein [Marinobacter salexigens]|uniref:DUF4339 domain-containing protein n=1 Tax=Marinobacter salexigens TaxID=1925763 RepID=UPI000C28FDDB|nr:DUF4339 domain-containing protein [Marinobacter salexigens]
MKKWHYITKNGERGPVSSDEMRDLYEGGSVDKDTPIWKEGMTSWEPLSFHPNLYKATVKHQACFSDDTKNKEPLNEPSQSDTVSDPSFNTPLRRGQPPASFQKIVLWVVIIITIGMILYPPFQVTYQGTVRNMGYHFLLSPPAAGRLVASVNGSFLLIQLLGVAIVGGALWLVTRPEENTSAVEVAGSNEYPSSSSKKIVFFILRVSRALAGFIAVWQVFGLMPAVTWIADPAALTPDIFARFFIKLILLIVSWFVFSRLHGFINRLHLRWNGSPHPALSKMLAL